MRVQINPLKTVAGKPITVINPVTGKPYPAGPFDLSAQDLRTPAVLRLLPPPSQGGVPGGVMADLVPVPSAPASSKK